jgi:Rrf2 family iron-sulfur cluster assembly transcriptional regulator
MGLSDQIRSYLKQISLGQLLERDLVSEVAHRQGQHSERVIDTLALKERKSA